MRHLILLIILIVLFGAVLPATAQTGRDVTRPQIMPRADGRLLSIDTVPRYQVPAMAIDRLVGEERWWVGYGMPSRYAAPHEVSITPDRFGVWERLGQNQRLWRVRIASPGALSLNLGFRRFALPPGARLYIFSIGDGGVDLGPFTGRDVDRHGQLWTPPITSDEVLITLAVPAARQHEVRLELGFINHGYAGFGESDPKSGRCNVDLGCSDAEEWRDEARAVGLISISGTYYCTAFLINNTAHDARPLLLTARHCGVHAGNAASVVVLWNHDFAGCRPDVPASHAGRVVTQRGASRRFQTGARWLADDPVSEFALLELDDPVDPALNLHFAGWDRRDLEPAESVVIHHPHTDAKRISIDRDAAVITSHLSAERPGNSSHLRIGSWELGSTEGGSSGAPLFNQAGRVVGLLHGGLAACGNQEPDWFGRLAAAWEGGGEPTSRLRDWLDPLGLGVRVLDGLSISAP